VRAGLSTRRVRYGGLVSMGAGLPTQRIGGCFLVRQGGGEYLGGVRGDPSLELLEFRR